MKRPLFKRGHPAPPIPRKRKKGSAPSGLCRQGTGPRTHTDIHRAQETTAPRPATGSQSPHHRDWNWRLWCVRVAATQHKARWRRRARCLLRLRGISLVPLTRCGTSARPAGHRRNSATIRRGLDLLVRGLGATALGSGHQPNVPGWNEQQRGGVLPCSCEGRPPIRGLSRRSGDSSVRVSSTHTAPLSTHAARQRQAPPARPHALDHAAGPWPESGAGSPDAPAHRRQRTTRLD